MPILCGYNYLLCFMLIGLVQLFIKQVDTDMQLLGRYFVRCLGLNYNDLYIIHSFKRSHSLFIHIHYIVIKTNVICARRGKAMREAY